MKNFLADEFKLMLLASFLCLTALFAIFVFTFVAAKNSPKKISESYKKIIIDNSLGEEADFEYEDSNTKAIKNIKKSVGLIKRDLEDKAEVLNYDKGKIDGPINEINSDIDNQKYKESYEQTRKLISDMNALIASYKKAHASDMNSFNGLTKEKTKINFLLKNVRIEGAWAVATIVPVAEEADRANILFKKEAGKWKIVAGPINIIQKNNILDGAPDFILKNLNTQVTEERLIELKL